MPFDNLEYLTVQKQTTDFPKHFHETFCISIIHKGIEQIDFDHQKIYSGPGTISIANPYEIHANPLIDSDVQVAFDTLYISKDLMRYLLAGKTITFPNRTIQNPEANRLFVQLKKAIDGGHVHGIEDALFQFVGELEPYAEEKKADYLGINFAGLNDINEYIDHHICKKLSLDELCQVVNINKFGFAKKFKASTGMTPMNYILMKKIFSSKKLIAPDSELSQIAIDYNFTDLPHFSKTFKRFIGLSPRAYQESLSQKE